MITPDETVTRVRRVLLKLGWQHPFFLPAVARVDVRADDTIPTACVTRQGVIRISPAYAASLPDDQLAFVAAHELLHLMLVHWARCEGRELRRWNYASDRVINYVLRTSGFRPPPGVLFPRPGEEEYNAEQTYTTEPQPVAEDGLPSVGQGCGVEEDSSGGGTEELPPADRTTREWREIAAQARALDRQAGQGQGSKLTRLLDIPPTRVQWRHMLRRSLLQAAAEHGSDDVSWTRAGRRTVPGVARLPGGVALTTSAAVVIDTSGSMSDADLARCVRETLAIAAQCQVGIYLVAHDSAVQFAGQIRPRAKAPTISARLTGRGGTIFGPAYAAVQAAQKRFDVMIHLTDGECADAWPARPRAARRLIVGLLGDGRLRACVPADARIVALHP